MALLALSLALTTMIKAQIPAHAVEIIQDFDNSPEKVWRAWTDATLVAQWFGSNANGRVLDAKLDVRPGGTFSVTFTDADGTEHTCSGEYIDVQPHSRLSFTWRWKSEPGVQTLVTVSLAPHIDKARSTRGTRMRFEHSQLIQASAHDYASGWRGTFAKLERVLAGG